MSWTAFAYVLLVLFTGVPAIVRGDVASGLAGTIAPFLALMAGGGIVNVFRERSYPLLFGIAFGLGLYALAYWWITTLGWWVKVGAVEFSGGVEVALGFGVGMLFEMFSRERSRVPVDGTERKSDGC